MSLPQLPVSSGYINWTLNTNRGIMGHFYKFISATGVEDYFTDMDLDITLFGVTWKSGSLRFEGLHRKLAVGLAVDEQTVKIWAQQSDTLFGANFLQGAQDGLLNGVTIVRYRFVWQFVTGNVQADVKQQPLANWILFTGYTGQILKGGASHIELKVESALKKLDTNMPRNYYQAGCLWTLFDTGCTLHKSDYTTTAAVVGANSIQIAPAGGVINPDGADGNPSYAQGRLLFTSGVLSGLQVLISTNDSNILTLAYPLNELPTVGDTFQYWPGCSKTFPTCSSKFNNSNNYRGFDKVPPIMLSS